MASVEGRVLAQEGVVGGVGFVAGAWRRGTRVRFAGEVGWREEEEGEVRRMDGVIGSVVYSRVVSDVLLTSGEGMRHGERARHVCDWWMDLQLNCSVNVR